MQNTKCGTKEEASKYSQLGFNKLLGLASNFFVKIREFGCEQPGVYFCYNYS